MKITLSNLLFAVTLVALSLAWWIDRSALIKKSRVERTALIEKHQADELRNVASFRVLTEARLTSTYFPHDEEQKIYDILDSYNLNPAGLRDSAKAYKILAIHDHYDKFEDKQFADRFVELALLVNEWESADDLLVAIEKQLDLASKYKSDDSDLKSLTEFIEQFAIR